MIYRRLCMISVSFLMMSNQTHAMVHAVSTSLMQNLLNHTLVNIIMQIALPMLVGGAGSYFAYTKFQPKLSEIKKKLSACFETMIKKTTKLKTGQKTLSSFQNTLDTRIDTVVKGQADLITRQTDIQGSLKQQHAFIVEQLKRLSEDIEALRKVRELDSSCLHDMEAGIKKLNDWCGNAKALSDEECKKMNKYIEQLVEQISIQRQEDRSFMDKQFEALANQNYEINEKMTTLLVWLQANKVNMSGNNTRKGIT